MNGAGLWGLPVGCIPAALAWPSIHTWWMDRPFRGTWERWAEGKPGGQEAAALAVGIFREHACSLAGRPCCQGGRSHPYAGGCVAAEGCQQDAVLEFALAALAEPAAGQTSSDLFVCALTPPRGARCQ